MVGNELSGELEMANGTPPGECSPVLFKNILVNGICSRVGRESGLTFFADEGTTRSEGGTSRLSCNFIELFW